MTPRAAVIIPVKGFADAKSRLAPVLDAAERRALARYLAERTVRVATSLEAVEIVAVTPDRDTAAALAGDGLRVMVETGTGLNAALAEAAGTLPPVRTVVLPGDLPEVAADDIEAHLVCAGIGLSPDRACRGTNMLSLPAPRAIPFRFGPDSLQSHAREAHLIDTTITWIARPALAYDLDTPGDLSRLKGWP